MNVGFKHSQKYNGFDCFVFHDVDMMPEDDRNDYGCPSSVRHMAPAVDKFNYKLVLFKFYLMCSELLKNLLGSPKENVVNLFRSNVFNVYD